MVKRIGTKMRKTRYLYKKNYREKGKISLSRYFQELQTGDRVSLKADSGVPLGFPFRRFQGFTGQVTGKRGACYAISIRDGGKEKTVYVHPIHLIKQNQ